MRVLLLVALVAALGMGWHRLERNRTEIAKRTQAFWERLRTGPSVRAFRTRYPRASAFLAKRFARGEYLGLHLTVGFLISVLGLWAFVALTEDVLTRDPITAFDSAVVDWFRGRATPTGYGVVDGVSLLGSPAIMAVIAFGIGGLILARRRWIMAGGWFAAFFGGTVLNQVLKAVIHRPRPDYASDFLASATFAFPSGHAMMSVIGYGMLAYVLVVYRVHNPRARVAVVAMAAATMLVVGATRLYLGVHYFSDVMAGFAAGILWLSACVSGLEVARRWKAGRRAAD